MNSELEAFLVWVDDDRDPEEVRHRAMHALPDWPQEVIEDTWVRHAGTFNNWPGLDYGMLSFSLATWTTDDMRQSGLDGPENEVIVDRIEKLKREPERVFKAERFARIREHLVANGTWPVPVVVLDNKSRWLDEVLFFRPTAPFHLFEGHWRTSIWMYFDAVGLPLAERHEVWIASRLGVGDE